ncbi:MAG TPA: TauD/TfdA family dioxygenase [Acidobacteriota bacterium]|nr:TauD/TfdA family dioxygenase [Acidobacteriota bacterium]
MAEHAGLLVEDVFHDDEWLTVRWLDGQQSRFPAIWLRDNIPSGRHTREGQRLFDIAQLPDRITLSSAALTSDGGLAVTFDPEQIQDVFEVAWLERHRLDRAAREARDVPPTLWSGEHQEKLEFIDYDRVAGDPTELAGWLRTVRDYGFALLRNVPTVPATVLEVVQLFGFVRETNYGRLFDVLTKRDAANLADTSMAVGAHTDNPYRDPVPGLQLLHCPDSDVEGGLSVLVDGFSAAECLREDARPHFDLLREHAVAFRYTESGSVDLRSAAPLIQTDPSGRVLAVRYNSRSAAPLDMPVEVLPRFYDAYRHFGRLLEDPSAQVSFKLGPGDLMLLDNQRVLHARTGFTGSGRHLQGCYADKDGLHSTLRVLEGRG